MNDTVLEIYNARPKFELGSQYSFAIRHVKFTDVIWLFRSYRMTVVETNLNYFIETNRCGNRFVFRLTFKGQNYKVNVGVKENAWQFISDVANRFNQLDLDGLEFEVKEHDYPGGSR